MTLDHKYNVAYWVDILSEKEFILASYYYCESKGRDHSIVQWLYKLGVDYNKLSIPYDEFALHVTGRDRPHLNRRNRSPYRWSRVNADLYREGTKYRKNASHEKKEISQRQLWRKISGLEKDKSRHRSWKSNRRTCARKAANGAYRQWCRQMILKENYDILSQDDTDWKLFHDPWDWD